MSDAMTSSPLAGAEASYIDRLRGDIAAMQPDALRELHIARATDHLHAYIEVTQAALLRVRTNLDRLQALAEQMPSDAQATTAVPLQAIREACLQQECATDRLRKIDSTLDFVGRRLEGLHRLLEEPGAGDAEIIDFRPAQPGRQHR